MDKLKDFIYDKNDVIVAALILIVAALIITWRMHIILEYPKTLINDNDIQTEEAVGDDSVKGDAQGSNSEANADGDASGDAAADSTQDSDNNAQSGTQTTAQLWTDGKLTQDIEVTVDGATASAAVQCLIDKELFADYAEYQSLCETLGLNHEKVSGGTFTFEKGSTKDQIAKRINWS